MLIKFIKNIFLIIFIITLVLKSLLAGCMSARSSGGQSDADCYLNHLARENVMRMGLEGGCDSPRQQVIYPDDNGKMYMPRGTLLFRCNDYSGCCPQKEHSCQPLVEEELRVAFFGIDCNGGDTRPTPEYVMMKNHTRCGCRPKMDDSLGFDSPQRLQDTMCGGGSGGYQMRAQPQQYPSYRGYGQSGYSSQAQQYSPPQSSRSQPCGSSMSSRPLVDGQVVRGTIRLTVGARGFMQSQQQSQPCPYG